MLSVQIAISVISFSLMVFVVSLDVVPCPPNTGRNIEEILNSTFDAINVLANQAATSIFAFGDNQTVIATKLVNEVTVSGDVGKLVKFANRMDQEFYAEIDHTIDVAILGSDKLFQEADQKIESLFQDSRHLMLVDRTLQQIQDISWKLQDWSRRYVSLLKPDLIALVHQSLIAAGKAHKEALVSSSSEVAMQKFLGALHSGVDLTKDLMVRGTAIILKEFSRATDVQREWAHYLQGVCDRNEQCQE